MAKKKKVPVTKADGIFEEFRRTTCVKLRKISSEGCNYHSDCNVATCLVKYILGNYLVYEYKEVEDE